MDEAVYKTVKIEAVSYFEFLIPPPPMRTNNV